jgi:hypothetical protein
VISQFFLSHLQLASGKGVDTNGASTSQSSAYLKHLDLKLSSHTNNLDITRSVTSLKVAELFLEDTRVGSQNVYSQVRC